MTTVETALGPVATAELGPTLMHEHIVTRSPGVMENWPHLWDRPAILAPEIVAEAWLDSVEVADCFPEFFVRWRE